VPPLFFAGTRFIAAGALILLVTAALRGPKELAVQKADIWPLTVMTSLVVSICFSLIFWGEQFVSASVTAIIVQGMIPIFLPFFAFLLASEQMSITRIVSIILGILGIFCIFVPKVNGLGVDAVAMDNHAGLQALGLVAIVSGTLAYCYGSVLGRPILGRNSAVSIAGWQNLLGGLLVLVASLPFELPYHRVADYMAVFAPNVLFAWAWLVVIGSAVGFVLYIVLLKAWGPSKLSPYAFATPLVAIMLDYLLFDQLIDQIEALGLLIIFIALGFAFYRPRAN
jgi:drug/metabolite transporter (DMT)-like permease